ncbi:MAG: alginate export family protein [Bacteroidota bacterium]
MKILISGIVFVRRLPKRYMTLWLLSIVVSVVTQAQRSARFNDQRALEDYSHLRDSINLIWSNAIKYVALDKQKNSYLSIGGSVRPRYELLTNQRWIPENNQSYYSQRIAVHTDWRLGKYVRLFGELQHGYVSQGYTFLQSDDLAVHQGFLELKNNAQNLSFRLGRQEMRFGEGRLYDFGKGPNIRRTFDIGKFTFSQGKTNIQAFYGKAVRGDFGIFDNEFNLFKANTQNQIVWGVYTQFQLLPNEGEADNTEIYYLGLETGRATFNDVTGEENRHTIGIRRYGQVGARFTYNTELIYQFGYLADNTISAFNIETDWQYSLVDKKGRPTFGLKLDWSSGDAAVADGKINSFNPMFVNPAIYSLAVVNTPVNLLSIHPAFTIFPSKKMIVEIEYVFFFRASLADGLYAPPNRLTLMSSALNDRHIGNSIGLLVVYNFDKHFNFTLRTSYYRAGDFVTNSGLAKDIFQFSPTFQYTF